MNGGSGFGGYALTGWGRSGDSTWRAGVGCERSLARWGGLWAQTSGGGQGAPMLARWGRSGAPYCSRLGAVGLSAGGRWGGLRRLSARLRLVWGPLLARLAAVGASAWRAWGRSGALLLRRGGASSGCCGGLGPSLARCGRSRVASAGALCCVFWDALRGRAGCGLGALHAGALGSGLGRTHAGARRGLGPSAGAPLAAVFWAPLLARWGVLGRSAAAPGASLLARGGGSGPIGWRCWCGLGALCRLSWRGLGLPLGVVAASGRLLGAGGGLRGRSSWRACAVWGRSAGALGAVWGACHVRGGAGSAGAAVWGALLAPGVLSWGALLARWVGAGLRADLAGALCGGASLGPCAWASKLAPGGGLGRSAGRAGGGPGAAVGGLCWCRCGGPWSLGCARWWSGLGPPALTGARRRSGGASAWRAGAVWGLCCARLRRPGALLRAGGGLGPHPGALGGRSGAPCSSAGGLGALMGSLGRSGRSAGVAGARFWSRASGALAAVWGASGWRRCEGRQVEGRECKLISRCNLR
ncbi:hypothetical protein GDO86_018496 [Hymenochirus boettgeri]|uniref:Uncharacterized protein n=1 Tax=Hymenochirus boettgeri TaxID=247094 RepID=A0A8T2IFR6_9PIPI|nr:hypothetical protein GDO86_018496 [Hymenochirus boettgeri]